MNALRSREPGTVCIPTWRLFDNYDDLYVGEWSAATYALQPEHLPLWDDDLVRVGQVWVDEDSREFEAAINNTRAALAAQGDPSAHLLDPALPAAVRLAHARRILQMVALEDGMTSADPDWPTPGHDYRIGRVA